MPKKKTSTVSNLCKFLRNGRININYTRGNKSHGVRLIHQI